MVAPGFEGYTMSGNTQNSRSLSLTAEELALVSAQSWATVLAAGILSTRSRPEGNYYLDIY